MSAGTIPQLQSGKTPRQLDAILAAQSQNLLAALSNHISQTNGAPIAAGGGAGSAGNQVTWTTSSFVSKSSGKVLIMANMYVRASAVDNEIEFFLVRDAGGVEVLVGAAAILGAGHVIADCSMALSWIDSVVPGASHTYAIRAGNLTGGQTVQVLAAAEAQVTLIELPG
jgi:hypothetical protein